MKNTNCIHYFVDFIFDILILQTIDLKIQHGDYHCVKHRGHFGCVSGVFVVRHIVEKGYGDVEDDDGGEARGMGEEDFVVFIS